MNIIYTGRKVTIKDRFKDYSMKRLEKLNRIFGEDADAHVTATLEHEKVTVEVAVKRSGMVFRSEHTSTDMDEAFDASVDAIVKRIRKNKSRLEKKFHKNVLGSDDFWSEESQPQDDRGLVRTKEIPVRPLDVEEAILEMNMLGHSFYVFRNMVSEEINVIYRRKDESYGLLIPTAD
jgi:putative sigma-54 modulation protein